MFFPRSHMRIYTLIPLVALIFFACACQGMGPPSPAAATVHNIPKPAPTTTPANTIIPATVVLPSDTPTPNAAPESPVAPESPLTSGGPWLLYQRVRFHPEGGSDEMLFVSNQDGSGSQIVKDPACENTKPVSIPEDPANRLVTLAGKFVLTNLERALIQNIAPDCRMAFTGSQVAGLVATIERTASLPELHIYALPEGKLRSSFPVPSCSRSGSPCAFDTATGEWVARWDPSGRYLVFPAILDGARSDLYLYDTHLNETRLLASIPSRLSRVWWSPGGKNILLGVSPHGDFFLESFWTVSVPGGEARRLMTTTPYLSDVDLLDWLDEDRFLFYSGSLQNIVTAGAYNLRLLDIGANIELTLFGDGFISAGVDRQVGVVGVVAAIYNSQYEDGVYLIPVAKPTPHKFEPVEVESIYNTYWDKALSLFVTSDPCLEGGQGQSAFDSTGRWTCVQASSLTDTPTPTDYISPDGQWRGIAKEGLWIEHIGKPAVKVQEDTPTQVIWRPDSGGFFFIANTRLSYVSLPDLTVYTIEDPEQLEGLRWSAGPVEFLWIENDERK